MLPRAGFNSAARRFRKASLGPTPSPSSTMKSLIEQIRQRAQAFRRALERVAPQSAASALQQFPHGSCGDVSELLGTYLRERNFGDFDYVWAQKYRTGDGGGYMSHAWLQQGDLIIDITADQFPEMSEPVIVGVETAWHRSFERWGRRTADFRTSGSFELLDLAAAYRQAAELADEEFR